MADYPAIPAKKETIVPLVPALSKHHKTQMVGDARFVWNRDTRGGNECYHGYLADAGRTFPTTSWFVKGRRKGEVLYY